MVMQVYCVMDRKLREFGVLHIERNDETMERNLIDGVRSNPESMLAKYPEDFDVYSVGEYETETGEIRQERVQLMVNLRDLLDAKG